MVEFIVTGRAFELLYFIGFLIVILYTIQRTKKGWLPYMRHIPALDVIDEMVGRCVEKGRPIHVNPGLGGLEDQTIVGFEIVHYTALLAAQKGCEVIATAATTVQLPIIEELVRSAFIEAGTPESYKPDNVRFLSSDASAYVTGVQSIVEREKCAGNISVGQSSGYMFMLFARAKTVVKDVMQLGGTAKVLNTPHLIASCDYVLIGEELYASQAYLTKDPALLAALFSQDIFKILFSAVLVLGLIITAAGSNIITQILSM
jgi:hypothetical protein